VCDLLPRRRPAGYRVIAARAVGAAWTSRSARGPDLAVVDLNLPDISGFQVIENARLRPAHARAR